MKHKKTGWYEHLCLLIFAQGKWNEKDKAIIRKPLLDKRRENKEDPYPFFTKLTHRKDPPEFSNCELCERLYEMFSEIKGSNDGILYQGHHYLIMEDDIEDMIELPDLILSNEKVKKFYFLYIDGFSDMKTTDIRAMDLNQLKENLVFEKYNINDFLRILEENKFKPKVVYEILKF